MSLGWSLFFFFSQIWTCIIILHPLNKHSATLTRIWNSLERHIPNSSLNAQNDRMKRCRAAFTSHPQLSFFFSLSHFLMELYGVWTHGNLVHVKSRCRDASLWTLAQFHYQYQRSLKSQWFSVSITKIITKYAVRKENVLKHGIHSRCTSMLLVGEHTVYWCCQSVFFQCTCLHFRGFRHVFYKWTVQNALLSGDMTSPCLSFKWNSTYSPLSSSFSSWAALTLGNSHPQSLPL